MNILFIVQLLSKWNCWSSRNVSLEPVSASFSRVNLRDAREKGAVLDHGGEKSQRRGNKSNFSPRQPAVSSVVKSPIKLAGVFFLWRSHRGSAPSEDVLGQLGNEEGSETIVRERERERDRERDREKWNERGGDKGWRLGMGQSFLQT